MINKIEEINSDDLIKALKDILISKNLTNLKVNLFLKLLFFCKMNILLSLQLLIKNQMIMKRILLSICIIAFAINSYSQSVFPVVVSPIGSYYKNSTTSLSWTLGEVVVATLTNDSLTLMQGFQHPKFYIISINENNRINPDIAVYPNPTANFININFKSNFQNHSYAAIYNLEGKKLLEKQLNNYDNAIDLSCYESSILLLKIFDSKENIIKTYKIQKLN
jgi:hypothetical protein